MKRTTPSLGPLGSKFFAWVQMRELNLVKLGELQVPLGISASQEKTLLKRLAKNGFIMRLIKGIYLVPNKIPAGGYWQPNEYYTVKQFMNIMNAKYYIGGTTALHHYGFIQQIPTRLTVYNDKISGIKTFGRLDYQFIKISNDRIGSHVEIQLPNQHNVFIATLTRTLLDAVQDWKKYQTLPQAYSWIKELTHDKKLTQELINTTEKYGNKNTMRRIGFFLEQCNINSRLLNRIHQKLRPTSSWIVLDPNKDYKGKTNKKWRVIDNVK